MKNIVPYTVFEKLDSDKKKVIEEVIQELQNITEFPVSEDFLQQLANKLTNVGIKPVDIKAAIYDSKKQKQYLIDGPSSPNGGLNGTLKDLQKMLN